MIGSADGSEDDSFPFWPFLLIFVSMNLNHRRQRFFHLESSIKEGKGLILANVGSENEEGCSPPQAELFKEQPWAVWIFHFKAFYVLSTKLAAWRCDRE